ncbi:unnamed protein product [Parajaminaea phylloscopi]
MSDAERSRGATPSGANMTRVNSSSSVAATGEGSNGGRVGTPLAGRSRYNPLMEDLRERSPEPDEDFRMEEQPTAWLVKVPRFLYEGWSKLSEEDLNLGTVRVYDADHKGRQRIELLLPSAPNAPIPLPEYEPATAGRNVKRIPRQYEVKLSSDASETTKRNIFAFREKELTEPGAEDGDVDIDDADEDIAAAAAAASASTSQTSRYRRRPRPKISTSFAGKITNEAAVKPILSSMSGPSSRSESPGLVGVTASESKSALTAGSVDRKPGITPEYREILRRRKNEASRPKRTVKLLDESEEGANNMLMAGLGGGHLRGKSQQPSSFIVQNSVSGSGAGARGPAKEKFARIPKNELLDLLFSCYERYTYWTLRALREETRQPESYLREVLSSIADQHKRGPYVGQWSLKVEYIQQRKEEEAKRSSQLSSSGNPGPAYAPAEAPSDAAGAPAAGAAEEEGDEDMEEVI